ncbi:hypothetical protein Pme01_59820 [Planosporangium mesophilum]|uniref:Uncharacterized protein n=1 Tax=Planosporangium mesophilum TaxID=689768 RepID=A0A8J3TSB6_9ACTN|nr:hypothetical protein Pme01_59820 [Planosporangium mesophilum]
MVEYGVGVHIDVPEKPAPGWAGQPVPGEQAVANGEAAAKRDSAQLPWDTGSGGHAARVE